MAATEKQLQENEQQNGAVEMFNQLMKASVVVELCSEITPNSLEALVDITGDVGVLGEIFEPTDINESVDPVLTATSRLPEGTKAAKSEHQTGPMPMDVHVVSATQKFTRGLNQLMNTSEVVEVCPEITPNSEEYLVGITGDHVSDSVELDVDMTDQTAVEAIVVDIAGKTGNRQNKKKKKKRSAKVGSKPCNNQTTAVPPESSDTYESVLQSPIKDRRISTPIRRLPVENKAAKYQHRTATLPLDVVCIAHKLTRLKALLDVALDTGLRTPRVPNEQEQKEDGKPPSSKVLITDIKPYKFKLEFKNNPSLRTSCSYDKALLFKCIPCQKSFTTKHSLMAHEKLYYHLKNAAITAAKEMLYSCLICGKTYTRYEIFQKHQKLHSSTGVTSSAHCCSHCGLQFKNQMSLKYHNAMNHSQSQKNKVMCEICGSFIDQTDLERHRFKHSDTNNDKRLVKRRKRHTRKVHNTHLPDQPNEEASPEELEAMAATKIANETDKVVTKYRRSAVKRHVCHCGRAFHEMCLLRSHMMGTHGELLPFVVKKSRVLRVKIL